MKIALIGYGKMGQIIDTLAQEKGHDICARIDINGQQSIEDLIEIRPDVAIEFTNPESSPSNIEFCIRESIPIVVGSTGWYDHYDRLTTLCAEQESALFTATNFSIGVNIFFSINEYLARKMNDWQDYAVQIEETHHIHKVDAPSGTAITIADGILASLQRKESWKNQTSDLSTDLEILSHRENEVPGTHAVTYSSAVDSIEIKHTAHSRLGFAHGAIKAAEWLVDKQGVFGMADMLNM